MSKRKAITLFKDQIDRIHPYIIFDNNWTAFTADLIKMYIGTDTSIYKTFYYWHAEKPAWYNSKSDFENFCNSKAELAKIHLQYCILHIQNHGTSESFSKSVTMFLSENWKIAIFTVLATFSIPYIYNLGVNETKNKIDKEKFFLEKQNDSLRRLIPSVNKITDSTYKKAKAKNNP